MPSPGRADDGPGARRDRPRARPAQATSKTRKRGRIAATRTALTAWLGRPLASFHLVLAICALLIVLGLVMVLSASSVISLNQDASAYTVFGKQLIFVLRRAACCSGSACGCRCSKIRAASPVVLWISVLMLVLVLIPDSARQINGTRSWFTIGPVGFQPVEVAKLALALWGAHILVVKRGLLHQYRHLLVPVVPAALVMFALVMLQPDLGGTVTLGVVLIALLWFAGAQLRLFGALALGGLAGVVRARDRHRLPALPRAVVPRARRTTRAARRTRRTRRCTRSPTAGCSARVSGRGRRSGSTCPTCTTTSSSRSSARSSGSSAARWCSALFGMLAVVGMRVATRNIDPWIRMVAATLTVWLVAQAAINIGYVVDLLPVTGITLPLISSGGTSVVITHAGLRRSSRTVRAMSPKRWPHYALRDRAGSAG